MELVTSESEYPTLSMIVFSGILFSDKILVIAGSMLL
jgi:hypothetical protein